MISETDKLFMEMALIEARKGIGRTSPNPCVGSVIVKEGRVIGKGYHKKAGTPHAEIHALRQAGDGAQGATLYVTLEPCSHTGRTPPCCEAIAASGLRRVVMGMVDPNPLVQGRGSEFLMSKGIAVTTGVLEKGCRELNRSFIKHITTGRPWVVMKAGMSLDGKITYQGRKTGSMTGAESLAAVHRLRNVTDAIMVGIGTVRSDNPSLTTRLSSGKRGRDPLRVVVDSRLSISEEARILSLPSAAPTWIFCSEWNIDAAKVARLEEKGNKVCRVDTSADGGLDLRQILHFLGKSGVTSLLVEGGARLHGAMLRQQLYDYANLFYAPLFAGEQGISVIAGYESSGRETAFRLSACRYRRLGMDMMVSGCLDYLS